MPLLVKDDFKTHIYPEITALITRTDDTLINKAISNAEGEARSYLNRFDLDTMFQTTFNNEHLKGLVKDIACWHLIKLANPNVNLELFRTAYEDAIKFLDKVQRGYVDPEWPLRNNPDTTLDESGHISWSSNTKRKNHY